MAEINGGNFGEGMTVAAINKLIISEIAKQKDELGLSGDDLRWISALVGGAISEAIGGNVGQGAGIADSATRNNELLTDSFEEAVKEAKERKEPTEDEKKRAEMLDALSGVIGELWRGLGLVGSALSEEGKPVASQMLDHALRNDGEPLVFGDGSSAVEKMKKSPELLDILSDSLLNELQGEDYVGSKHHIDWKSDSDLFLGFGRAEVYITAHKLPDGTIQGYISVVDTWDIHLFQDYSNLKVTLINNSAWLGQDALGVVRPYRSGADFSFIYDPRAKEMK